MRPNNSPNARLLTTLMTKEILSRTKFFNSRSNNSLVWTANPTCSVGFVVLLLGAVGIADLFVPDMRPLEFCCFCLFSLSKNPLLSSSFIGLVWATSCDNINT